MNVFKKSSLSLAVILATVTLYSCSSINQQPENCGVYLQFVYDHNMEYVDSFNPQVSSVDVYVFDEAGNFLFSESAASSDLVDGNKMLILGDAPSGKYHVLSIGGLCDHFSVSGAGGTGLTTGSTSLNAFELACVRTSSVVEHQLNDLWFGKVIEIDYTLKRETRQVEFVKNTNRFNITLVRQDSDEGTSTAAAEYYYSFEIATPEGAAYSWENQPLSAESVTYKPYYTGTNDVGAWLGNISTVRLLDSGNDYRIRVNNTTTGERLWDYDLMKLLSNGRPVTKPDGATLPFQEYLDRQSVWDLAILYKGDGSEPGSFVALGVRINGWLFWLKDIEM